MNYLMFHQSGEGQFLKVPDGLKQLMSDISREVLREQPENIYEFIADYLEEMELAREHKGSMWTRYKKNLTKRSLNFDFSC